MITKGTGLDGSPSVVLTNKFVGVLGIGSNAPAFITFATPWVYAVTTLTDCDGGAYGGINFTHRPDAIKGLYKRTKGDAEEEARIIAYLWKGTFKSTIKSNTSNDVKEDVDRVVMGYADATESGTLIASCDYGFSSTKNDDWEEIVVPLEYKAGQENEIPEKMNVIISSADYWTRDNIQKNSVLEVDDVEFVYYSQLSSLSYDGKAVTGFDKDVYTYAVDEPYDATKLQAVADGKGATVTTSYDAATGKCVVRVEGNDISVNTANYHEYTIQFPIVTSFTNVLTVGINGSTSEPQTTAIQLVKEIDGTYSFVLKNFILGSDDSVILVGNIRLTNLTVNGNVFTADQRIQILPGDLEEFTEDDWYGPMLGDVPVKLRATKLSKTEMVADIDIDMTASLEQMIKVVFAPLVEINETEDMPALNGLYNVKLNRKFVAGWNTVCLPFDYQAEAFWEVPDVKAQSFESVTEEGLNFKSVEEGGVLAANTPYLIYFQDAATEPVYFGVNIESTTPKSVTHGDFTFTGTYAALTDMAGKYGVATIDGEDKITLGAAGSFMKGTRAYFTTSGAAVQSVKLNFFDGEATGIEAIGSADAEAFDVYTLSGVQVRRAAKTLDGLQKGIYIVNGKKQVVK